LDYETEEQQVEAIKKWWHENGRSVILGVVIGAAAIFGWQGWGKYQIKQSEAASDEYTATLDALQQDGDPVVLAESLQSEYSDSMYSIMASLAAAKDRIEAEDLDGAPLIILTKPISKLSRNYDWRGYSARRVRLTMV